VARTAIKPAPPPLVQCGPLQAPVFAVDTHLLNPLVPTPDVKKPRPNFAKSTHGCGEEPMGNADDATRSLTPCFPCHSANSFTVNCRLGSVIHLFLTAMNRFHRPEYPFSAIIGSCLNNPPALLPDALGLQRALPDDLSCWPAWFTQRGRNATD
jgi:hypothetical protein